MSFVQPCRDSDQEDIFDQDEDRKPVTPFEINKEELEDPYRRIKVDLASLLNIEPEPMSISQICWSYSALYNKELTKEARIMGLSVSELLAVVSNTITPLRGPNGETLYTAARSDKTKEIRSQIIQQNRAVKKDSNNYYASKPSKYVPSAAHSNQSSSVNNDYTKKNGSIPMSSLTGGPKSEGRCSLIVKMILDNGTYHQTSGRMRMRINELQQVYAAMLNNLPLWGSAMTEKEYADFMDSHEYDKYWRISSEKNCKKTSPDDELVYFIDVASDRQGSNVPQAGQKHLTMSDRSSLGRPSITNAAHRLIRKSLPSPEHSHLPCDRLPETRAELTLRRRDSLLMMKVSESGVYKKSELVELGNICDATEMVLVALKKFPELRRNANISNRVTSRAPSLDSKIQGRRITTSTSSNDSIVDQARLIVRKSLEQPKATCFTNTRASKTVIATDVEWLRSAPCIVDLDRCNFISGTPLFFLPPSSVLFGVRNGNDDSERIEAINFILQRYYKTKEWSSLECKPGVPCIARCFEDGLFSFVRAIIFEADVDGTFECVCMDISARINVPAGDIAPLPNAFSVNALPPSVFVARIRGVASVEGESQIMLQNIVRGYFENTEDNMGKPFPSAVFGRLGPECIVDWIDPMYQQWLSTILLEQPAVCSASDDLENPPVDDAVMFVQGMEEKGVFKYCGLEWCAEASELSKKEDISVKRNVKGPSVPPIDNLMKRTVTCDTDVNAPINVGTGSMSERMKHVDSKPEYTKECDARGNDNSAHFLTLFKNMFKSDSNTVQEMFLANALAFVSCAKIMMPTENWGAVLDEINIHF